MTDAAVQRPPYGGRWVVDPEAGTLTRLGPDERPIEVYDPVTGTITPVPPPPPTGHEQES